MSANQSSLSIFDSSTGGSSGAQTPGTGERSTALRLRAQAALSNLKTSMQDQSFSSPLRQAQRAKIMDLNTSNASSTGSLNSSFNSPQPMSRAAARAEDARTRMSSSLRYQAKPKEVSVSAPKPSFMLGRQTAGKQGDENIDSLFVKPFHPATDPSLTTGFRPCAYYIKVLQDALLQLQIQSTLPGTVKVSEPEAVKRLLVSERNTWLLVEKVMPFLGAPNAVYDELADEDKAAAMATLTDAEYIDFVSLHDHNLRLVCTVLEWLEDVSALDLKEFSVDVMYEAEDAGLQETQAALQAKQTTLRSGQPLVRSLDPDARTRTGAMLHPDDEKNLALLSEKVFLLLRSGQTEKAVELCTACNQYSQAAIIKATKPFSDPRGKHSGEQTPPSGCMHRGMYQHICLQVAQDQNVNRFERAWHGMLCGHLDSLLAVAETREDKLWAYYTCFKHHLIEKHINGRSKHIPSAKFLGPSLAAHVDEEMISLTHESIFEIVDESSRDFYCSLQALVIRDNLEDTFAVVQTVLHGDCAAVSEALADMTENESGLRVQMPYRTSMLLRFMCCFSLTLNRGQVEQVQPLVNKMNYFVSCYVEFLILQRSLQTAHIYIGHLESATQAQDADMSLLDAVQGAAPLSSPELVNEQCILLCSTWRTVTRREDQMQCIRFAEGLKLPVREAVNELVSQAAQHLHSSLSSQRHVAEALQRFLSEMSWMFLSVAWRLDLLFHVNVVLRNLINVGDLARAQTVLAKVPGDSADIAAQNIVGAPLLEEACILKEHESLKLLLQADTSYEAWMAVAAAKPQNLLASADTNTSSQLHHDTFQNRLASWQHSIVKANQDAIVAYSELLFMTGGWLQEEALPESAYQALPWLHRCLFDNTRVHVLQNIERQHLPQAVLRLAEVRKEGKQHRECAELAAWVANTEQAARLFEETREHSRALLAILYQNSVACLEERSDPLGFE